MTKQRITLDTLTEENVDDSGSITLIYGTEGMGKTSFGAEAPDNVFIRFNGERAPTGIKPVGWTIGSYAELMEAVAVLYTDEHPYRNLVIDNLTAIERKAIWPQTCETGDEKGRYENIEAFGFGRGYKLAMPFWEEFFEGLEGLRRDCGMNVILIAHSLVKNFQDPENPAHNVYDVDLQDADKVSAARFVKQKSDAVLFLKKDVNVEKEDPTNKFNKRVLAKGGSTRWIYTEGRPAFAAKNRYGMPEKIQYKRGEGFAEIAKYVPAFASSLPTKKAA